MNTFLNKKIDIVNAKIDHMEELLERIKANRTYPILQRIKANKQDDLIRDIKKKIIIDELRILNKHLNKLNKQTKKGLNNENISSA